MTSKEPVTAPVQWPEQGTKNAMYQAYKTGGNKPTARICVRGMQCAQAKHYIHTTTKV